MVRWALFGKRWVEYGWGVSVTRGGAGGADRDVQISGEEGIADTIQCYCLALSAEAGT